MGLLIELRTESGEVVDRVGESEPTLLLVLPDEEEEKEFPLLRFVDPYGDTVFNGLQSEALIPELKRLQSRATSQQQRKLMERVLELAEACRSSVHHYLVFVGD
jgi:hypothetical protein